MQFLVRKHKYKYKLLNDHPKKHPVVSSRARMIESEYAPSFTINTPMPRRSKPNVFETCHGVLTDLNVPDNLGRRIFFPP